MLAYQILVPRNGKLTNERCVYNERKECVREPVEYDLHDRETRLQLRKLKFICDVNGMIYRPAQEKPGLIHETHVKKCGGFLNMKCEWVERELDFIPIDETQKLQDARTVCYSWANYPIGDTP